MNPRQRRTARNFSVVVVTLASIGLFGVVCAIYFAPFVYAAPTFQINYQGKLMDDAGDPVTDGSYDIRFRIYTAASGGTALFDETHVADVNGGLFSLMLGSASTTVLETLNWNQTLYVGVEVESDGEMTPRKIIGSVPTAFDANRLGGFASSSFIRSDAANATSTASTFLSLAQSGAGKIMELIGQGSAAVLSVLSNGRVGVGTSTPSHTFSVEGASTLGNVATAGRFAATTTSASIFPYASSTALTVSGVASTSVLRIDTLADGCLNITSGLVGSAACGGASFGQAWEVVGTYLAPTTTIPILVNNATSTITNLVTVNSTSTNATTTNLYIGGRLGTILGQGWLNSDGTTITSSTSPTVNYVVATSSVASQFPYASSTALTVSGSFYNSDLTANRLVFSTTGGRLTDNGNFVVSTGDGTLSATNINTSNVSRGSLSLGIMTGSFSTAGTAVILGSGTYSNSSGGFTPLRISPTYNQSGTASSTDLWIRRSETALGSGNHYFIDAWAGGTSYFSVSNRGVGYFAGGVDVGSSTSTNATTTNLYIGGRLGTILGQGWLNSDGTTITSSTSPTVNYVVATSSVASQFPYASSTALTVSGSFYLGSLNGPLHANAGLISATSSIGVLYGGTGLTVAPTYGQILLGTAAGAYTLTSTSTLGIALSDTTGTLSVAQGGTGQTSFRQGWLHSDGTTLTASSSPTVNYIVATSTTVASTFAYRVGVGTTTPWASLAVNPSAGIAANQFVVGSSTATNFIIDNSGRIGIGGTTTPNGNNLVDVLSGTSGDWSTAFSIDHRNDANEDNTVLSLTNTASPGAVSGLTDHRMLRTLYSSSSPTMTLSSVADGSFYGLDQVISLNSLGFGDSAVLFSNTSGLSVYGSNAAITGNVTYNDTADAAAQTLSIYGANVDISSGLTITSISAGNANIADIYGGRFVNAQTSPGNADLTATSYGVYGSATGNLTTTGATAHYGGYFRAAGSADTNYGVYVSGSGATTNYGIYSDAGINYFAGNVGVASSTPFATLGVENTGSGLSFAVNDVASDSSPFVIAADGKVGVGTTTPVNNLSVALAATGNVIDQGIELSRGDGGYLRLTNRQTNDTFLPAIVGKSTDSTNGFLIRGLRASGAAASVSSFTLQAANTAGTGAINSDETAILFRNWTTDLMTLKGSGMVGVGTSTPFAFVSASTTAGKASAYAGAFVSQTGYGLYASGGAGAAYFVGNVDIVGKCSDTGSGCADIAEEYPSSEVMEPGDIAVIDPRTNKTVMKADIEHRANLIGIVATAPGLVLTDEGPVRIGGADLDPSTRPAIALAGRVPTKVSLEGGAIEPGDRITISSERGIGMRATSSGVTVGIALESFDEDSETDNEGLGRVLVFVNLAYYHLDSKIAQGIIEGSYWTLDEETGSIRALGPVDLNNFPILNVKAIQSASGKWHIDENGTLVVENLEVRGAATIGTPNNRTGITLYDEESGEPYCLSISGGDVESRAGACGVEDDPEPEDETPPSGGGGGGGDEAEVPPVVDDGSETGEEPPIEDPVVAEPETGSTPEPEPTPDPEPETSPEPEPEPTLEPEVPPSVEEGA